MYRIGSSQRAVLTLMAGTGEPGTERAYPNGGWSWRSRSETIAVIKRLESRGLVSCEHNLERWHITEKGKQAVLRDYTPPNPLDVRYEYGVRTQAGDTACPHLKAAAELLEGKGGVLIYREIVTGEWKQFKGP